MSKHLSQIVRVLRANVWNAIRIDLNVKKFANDLVVYGVAQEIDTASRHTIVRSTATRTARVRC